MRIKHSNAPTADDCTKPFSFAHNTLDRTYDGMANLDRDGSTSASRRWRCLDVRHAKQSDVAIEKVTSADAEIVAQEGFDAYAAVPSFATLRVGAPGDNDGSVWSNESFDSIRQEGCLVLAGCLVLWHFSTVQVWVTHVQNNRQY